MKTDQGDLSYCSNIHPGEIWALHFAELQKNVPLVKAQVAPNQAMGLGLRAQQTLIEGSPFIQVPLTHVMCVDLAARQPARHPRLGNLAVWKN